MKTNRLILCVVAITVAGCGKNTSASARRERRGRAHLGPSASRKPGAARGGIDEVNVPPHQFGKSRSDRRSAQKLLVGQLVHSWKSRSRRSNRTGSVSKRIFEEQW